MESDSHWDSVDHVITRGAHYHIHIQTSADGWVIARMNDYVHEATMEGISHR